MATSKPGAARAIPVGRLSDFEDAGDPDAQDSHFLKGLLTPRLAPRSRPAANPGTEPGEPVPPEARSDAAAADVVEDRAPEVDGDEAGPNSGGESGSVEPASSGISPAASIEHIGDGIRTTRPPRKRAPRRQTPSETPEATGDEELDPAGNKLRASNVHIPANFMPRLTKARSERRLSNGEWVIAALEATHDQLGSLIRAEPTGGSLFAPRATRAARTYDGPLTPFNIRLREADYTVIDELVVTFRASSRGHLITVAFDAFLPAP
ncbi:hypothetical protein SAMN05661080_04542 [Modestobacter sp. DSM 44400]|nr:hypothetical protein SAMN05661080_04542 [Modestobacter sp. DSM 44400]